MGIIFIIELPMGHANSIPQNRSLNRQVALSLWGTGTEYVNRLGVGVGGGGGARKTIGGARQHNKPPST